MRCPSGCCNIADQVQREFAVWTNMKDSCRIGILPDVDPNDVLWTDDVFLRIYRRGGNDSLARKRFCGVNLFFRLGSGGTEFLFRRVGLRWWSGLLLPVCE